MKSNQLYVLAAIAIVALIGYRTLFKSDDQKQIETLIQQAQDAMTFEAPLKPLQVPKRLNVLKDSIIPAFRASYSDGEREFNFSASEDMQSKAGPAALVLQSFSVFRTNTRIDLRGSFADARFQAAVSGSTRGGKTFSENVTVSLTLQKDGDDWFIRDASIRRLF